MASSTSAPSSQVWNHDVYISFRDKDTGNSFVVFLHEALQERGIHSYIYTESLSYGAPILPTLLKAIQESRFFVVVLSKSYPESSRCLMELEHIMKCEKERDQLVLPIFFDVEPSDVHKQKGAYKDAFRRHEHENNYKVESWRKALKEVGDLAGWELNSYGSRRTTFIKEIVKYIWSTLLWNMGIGDRLSDLKLRHGDSLIMVPSRPSYDTPESSSKLGNHSVFLSFREEDTRYNIVDYLCSALDQAEILTNYMDGDLRIWNGSLPPTHLKAIEESQIAIIIFSGNYADSSWCLDELAYIMECMVKRGKIVMPIYYGVDPSSVRLRRQTWVYGQAFARHKEDTKAESWRKALVDASNLFGLKIAEKHESKYIKVIVDTISKRLFPDKGFIGAQTRLEGLRYGGGGGGGMATFTPLEEVEHLKIPLQDIQLATNNFAGENTIARGGFGHVFRGQTGQHGDVAIKRLNRRDGQGEPQFMMEIQLLSTYKHENIVSLVGYCDEGGERILVYRYEKNGSLDKVLPRKGLTWIQRLQICLDAAHGLEYLHENVQHHIIVHRDIKSANILLDETWKAKISDFGLSKIALANAPSGVIFSKACGTPGYVDPLYKEHDMLTQKSDVYSFGIVMLEVLFGRLVMVDPKYPTDRYFLLSLAQDHYVKETLDEIIDSDLRSQMNSDSLVTFSRIAYQCLKKRREERPTMSLVVDQLEKALDYQKGLSAYLHDVYISFRDRDTECHIVDDIRAALDQEGISTYKDNATQSRKESILLKAIERSRLFVIIFTKKFAVNSWYLDEVAKITECSKEKGQFILPIFYNVSSSDVRTQKGYFGEVISEYDTHPRMEVWRKALVEATIAAGLEYSKFRCNTDLVKKVVEEIKSGLSENDKKKANVLDEEPKQPTE